MEAEDVLISDVDSWIETARKCQYLPEKDLKVSISRAKTDM